MRRRMRPPVPYLLLADDKTYRCRNWDDLAKPGVEGAAAKIMAEHQVKRLPVLNRQKRLVGIVALSDLGRADGDCAQTALEGISEETGQTRRI